MNVAPLFLLCGLCFIGMGDLSGSIPVAVQFGIIATVSCFFAIIAKIEMLRKQGADLHALSYASSMNKYLLAVMATIFVTWAAQTFLRLSTNICYLLSIVIGGTIEQTAPLLLETLFERFKNWIKGLKRLF